MKKEELILLGALIVLNVLMRIPFIPHEFGSDSFFIHTFANQIVEHEHAPWLIHPLSFFGLYPLSNASVVPILLAILSLQSGVGMEYVILYASMAFSILGALSAYALAGKIRNTLQFKFLTAFLFSLSPLALKFSGWTTSTRGLFLMMTPLLLWILLETVRTGKLSAKSIIIGLILFLTLAGTHKISVLIIPFIIVALSLILLKRQVNIVNKPILLSFAFIFLFFAQFFLYAHWWPYWNIPLNFPRNTVFTLIALLTVLFMRLGPILIFSVIGLASLIFKKEKSPIDNYLIITSLLFTPFLEYGMYFYQTLSIILVILSAYGFEKAFNLFSNQKLRSMTLIILLVSTVSFTFFTEFYRYTKMFPNGTHQYLDAHLYNAIHFLNTLDEGVISVHSSTSDPLRVGAFAKEPVIPNREEVLLGYGLIDEGSIQAISKGIPRSIIGLWEVIKYPFNQDYTRTPYNARYVVSNKLDDPNSFEVDKRNSNLTKIYDNNYEGIWSINNVGKT